jgi:ABC-type transport system involved in multi-copper enzyme maturation permease subunit
MIWLTWRQFRFQATVTLAILAAATVYIVVTGLQMHHTYTADLAACPHPEVGCFFFNSFRQSYNGQQQLLQLLVVAAPALIGIFWGAPLIAAEFERGSHRMTWNQSITPVRWLAFKLALLGLAALLTAGALSLLLTWWASPLDQRVDDRFNALVFATRNVVPLGYAAFAFALGTTLGLLIRRTLPAMAITLAVFIALQILFATVLRPNLLPSTTTTMPINAATLSQVQGIGQGADPSGPVSIFGPGPQDAWILSATDLENSSGQAISGNLVSTCLNGTEQDLSSLGTCLAPYNLHFDYTYQPAGNYWPLQWYETGIYLVLATLLGATCFWRIRRHRD